MNDKSKISMLADLLKNLAEHPPSRRMIVLFLVGAWLCFSIGQLTPSFDLSPDSAYYLTLAQSVAKGDGYTVDGRFARGYPPLFPLMLSTTVAPERHDYRPEKIIIAAAALGAILASYWFLSQRYRGWKLAALSFLLAVSPSLTHETGRILSDIPFFFFVMIFLAAAGQFWRAEKTRWALALLAAISMALATLTRSAGVALYLANFAWLARPVLWRQHARRSALYAALIILVACPPVIGWGAWVAKHRQEGRASYVEYAQSELLEGASPFSIEGAKRIVLKEVVSAGEQIGSVARTVFRVAGHTGGFIWAFAVVPLLLFGLARRLRSPQLSDYVFCAYGLMVLLWPSVQGTRLWLPMLPLMFGYLADAFDGFGELTNEFPALAHRPRIARASAWAARYQQGAAIVGAVFLIVFGVGAGVESVVQTWMERPKAVGGVLISDELLDTARFINTVYDRTVVMASLRHREIALAVARPEVQMVSLPEDLSTDPQTLLQQLRAADITHIAVPKSSDVKKSARITTVAETLRQAMPQTFSLIEETPHVRIFALLDG